MPSAQSRKRAFAYLALSGSSSGGQLPVEFRFRLPANLQRVAGRNRFGRKRKQWSTWLNVRVNIVDCSGRRDPRFFLKTFIPARAGTDGRPPVKAAANCLFSKLSNGGPEKFASNFNSIAAGHVKRRKYLTQRFVVPSRMDGSRWRFIDAPVWGSGPAAILIS